MVKRFLTGVAGVALVCALAAPARAANIDFEGIAGGTVNGDGITSLIGSGLNIFVVQGINTPLNNLMLRFVTSGNLNFSSATGIFAITGTVLGGNGDPFSACGVGNFLLCGTLLSFGVNPTNSNNFFFSGVSNISATLASFYGLDGAPFFDFSGNVSRDGINRLGFSDDVGNTPVPELGSMLLLGTGLLGLAAVARRRFGRN